MGLLQRGIELVEQGKIPDAIVRPVIRRQCGARWRETADWDLERQQIELEQFLDWMGAGHIAVHTERANEQHYEVPAEFFALSLGEHLKYSCCYWGPGEKTLEAAEQRSLELTCRHADLTDGQNILELGCGWGSLSLWMAKEYPSSRITAVSNSNSQREYIVSQAELRGLSNLRVITADMNDFQPEEKFDRVVSVEMFEHMRNYELLLGRIADWLVPWGKVLIHIFTVRGVPYAFETEGEENWMGRYFFTGGMMPSEELLLRFQQDLRCIRQWKWSGDHYRRTADAWLWNLDRNKDRAVKILQQTYGVDEGLRWFFRWRMFFMAVAELFGYRRGTVWGVTHTLLQRAAEE